MSKFDNRVYLTICDVSMKCFEASKFTNYYNYCCDMNLGLKSNSVVGKSKTIALVEIIKMLDIIYSMDDETTGKYIFDYFSSDKVREFEKCVLLNREAFPYSI